MDKPTINSSKVKPLCERIARNTRFRPESKRQFTLYLTG
jgi:hypothetical protein